MFLGTLHSLGALCFHPLRPSGKTLDCWIVGMPKKTMSYVNLNFLVMQLHQTVTHRPRGHLSEPGVVKLIKFTLVILTLKKASVKLRFGDTYIGSSPGVLYQNRVVSWDIKNSFSFVQAWYTADYLSGQAKQHDTISPAFKTSLFAVSQLI